MKNTLLLLLLMSLFGFTLGGCNTVEGLGKDVEKVGDEIEEAADEAGGELD